LLFSATIRIAVEDAQTREVGAEFPSHSELFGGNKTSGYININ
jgi:hypothetical protein